MGGELKPRRALGVAFLASLCSVWCAFGDSGLAPMICPGPRHVKIDDLSYVALDGSVPIYVECGDASAAEWAKRHFSQWFGTDAGVARSQYTGPDADGEAYRLSVGKHGVVLSARTLAGIRHAAHSLRQIAIPARGTLKVSHYIAPEVDISDSPALAFRGLHFCWFPETKPEEVERFVRLAGYLKFNHVVLESWGTYRSERFPWLGWPDAPMTKKAIARLRGIAEDVGVALVPAVNVFGHASHSQGSTGKHATLDFAPEYQPLFEPVMGWNWCLSNPEARRVLSEYVAEMHEAFGSPRYFHLGCDEANPPSCPNCRRAVYADLVVGHIRALAEVLERRGARAMIWHDMFLERGDPRWKADHANGSHELAARVAELPRSVVVCDWNYRPPRRDGDYPSLRHFKGLGFDVLACPYDATETIDAQGRAAATAGIMGFLGTTWLYPEGVTFSKLMIHDACAAWGGDAAAYANPWSARFLTLLRHVCWDMGVKDRTLTGVYRYQYHPYGGTKDSK